MAGTQRDPSLARSGDPHDDEDRSLDDKNRSLDDEAAPQDAKHEPQDHEDPPQDAKREPQDPEGAPQAVAAVYVDNRESSGSDDERAPESHVAPTALRAYLALPETQKHIYEDVKRFLGRKTPKDLRDDIVQQAYVAARALAANSRPPRSTPWTMLKRDGSR